MLSLFPSFFTYMLVGPLILRLVLGITLLSLGQKNVRAKSKNLLWYGVVEIVLGVLLVIGFLTQGAALIASIMLLAQLVRKIRAKAFLTDGVNYYLILFVIALSLLFLGPGFLAFDLML